MLHYNKIYTYSVTLNTLGRKLRVWHSPHKPLSMPCGETIRNWTKYVKGQTIFLKVFANAVLFARVPTKLCLCSLSLALTFILFSLLSSSLVFLPSRPGVSAVSPPPDREAPSGAELRQDVHRHQPPDLHRQPGGRRRAGGLHRGPPGGQRLPGPEVPGGSV